MALESTVTVAGVSKRKAQGAHYTPPALVSALVTEALRGWKPSSPSWRLLDPACGSGNFLVAAAREIAQRVQEPMQAFLSTRVFGVDIDPVAVKLARSALLGLLPPRVSKATREKVAVALRKHLIVHDALVPTLDAQLGDAKFDLILGNPPFLNQLEKGTAASRERARVIADATDGAVRRYADLAAAFLLTNLSRLTRGGRLAFVMPQSFLSTGDARAARDAALAQANLCAIWSCNESLFEAASVRVCTLVLSPRRPRTLRRAFGASFEPLASSTSAPKIGDESWSNVLAEAFGAPIGRAVHQTPQRTIGGIAYATADFRDQYYGLAGFIREGGAPRLVTTGHIDLAHCNYGTRAVRALGVRYEEPSVDRVGLAKASKVMSAWMTTRLVPKILVATQTKVIEAWVDARGEVLPLVPLLIVTPREGVDVWQLAAALASPIVAARAVAHYAGSALSSTAIKLSAKQLLLMPLPSHEAAWLESAQHFKRASQESAAAARHAALSAFALASCHAHRLNATERRAMLEFWNRRVERR